MITESLRFRLKNPNPQVREQAAMDLVFAPEAEYLQDLLELLSDSDGDVRRTAVQALGAINDLSALEGLRLALLDPEPEVVTASEHAISKFGIAGENSLREWLSHPDWLQRAVALHALALFAEEAHLNWIHLLVRDPIWEVRYEAYQLIGRTRCAKGLPLLLQAIEAEQAPQARTGVIEALGAIDLPEACSLLLSIFVDPSASEYLQALALALAPYGSQIHTLVAQQGLWSPHPEVRCLSAVLLAQTAYPELDTVLQPLLNDAELQVRQTVAYALYQANPHQPFWEYVAGLYHDSSEVFDVALQELIPYPDARSGACLLQALDYFLLGERAEPLIRALGEMAYDAAAPALIELLEILPELSVQVAICRTLGKLKAWRAYRPLQKLLGHPVVELQQAALQALAEISEEEPEWRDLPALEGLDPRARQRVLDFVIRHPEARGYLLRLALDSELPALHAQIFRVLAQAQAPELSSLLLIWLQRHPEPEELSADAVLQAIGSIGIQAGLAQILLNWLHSKSESIRLQVIHLLKPEVPRLFDRLLALSEDELWFVRQAALQTLGQQQDPRLLPRLETALEDRDRDVRITALQILGQYHSEKVAELLVKALENGFRDIRAAAARALGRQAETWVLESLEIALVEDEDAEVRRAAAESLCQLAHDELVDLLEDALQHEDETLNIASYLTLLHQQDPKAALPWLLKHLKSEFDELGLRVLNLLAQYPAEKWRKYQPELEKQIETGSQPRRLAALNLLLRADPEQAGHWLGTAVEQRTVDLTLQEACLQNLSPEQAKTHLLNLLKLIQSPSARLRQAVYRVWARSPELWPLLLQHAPKEQDPSTRHVLVELLAELPSELTSEGLFALLNQGTITVQKSVIWALMQQVHAGNKEALLQALQSQLDAPLRAEVFQMLVRAGDVALPLLKDLTEHWDRSLMLTAIRSLGTFGESVMPLLQELWQKDELAIQTAVLEALKYMPGPHGLAILGEAACSNQEHLRTHAFDALYQLGEVAIPSLKELAQHEAVAVRYDACLVLAELEPDSSVWLHLKGINSQLLTRRLSHLIKLQQEPLAAWFAYSTHLQQDAAYLVRQLYTETPAGHLPAWQAWLQTCFEQDCQPVRLRALLALSRSAQAMPEAAAGLKKQLLEQWSEASVLLREASLGVLAELGAPEQALVALSDASAWVRLSAVWVTGAYRLEAALSNLMDRLNFDFAAEIREAAAWALGRLSNPQLIPVLQQALKDAYHGVRYQAVIALGHLPHPEAAEALLNVLHQGESDVYLLEEVLRGLRQQAYVPATEDLIQLTRQHQDITLRLRALEALARIPASAAQSHLQEVIYWPETELSQAARHMLQIPVSS